MLPNLKRPLLIVFLSTIKAQSQQSDEMCFAEGNISQPVHKNGVFSNPKCFDFKMVGIWAAYTWAMTKDEGSTPKLEDLNRELPNHTPQFDASRNGHLQCTWIGHSTVVVQMDGVNFVTDPMWSDRASPVSFAGPKRFRPPPCTVEQLPKIDFVLISHNHYDHLDLPTLRQLHQRFQPDIRWYVPLGLKSTLESQGCTNVTEMTWGQSVTVPDSQGMQVVCLPAKHWSNRGLFDRFKTLWSSWAVIGPRHRFYFTGDSGYSNGEFEKIGKQFGPFDLAAIPIGCYKPREFMKNAHMNPDEAMQVHLEIRSRHSLGIHWATFPMGGKEHWLAPRRRLTQLAASFLADDKNGTFITRSPGETWVID